MRDKEMLKKLEGNKEMTQCINELWGNPENLKKVELENLKDKIKVVAEVDAMFLCSIDFIDILDKYKPYLYWDLLKEGQKTILTIEPR